MGNTTDFTRVGFLGIAVVAANQVKQRLDDSVAEDSRGKKREKRKRKKNSNINNEVKETWGEENKAVHNK